VHQAYLKEALALAEIRRGFCAPNPSVGAVVVKDNAMISRGFHRAAGQPHAEVEALKELGDQAAGTTVYVTLEPCCIWGRTPPCTQLLIERKVGRVVYGFKDPNPKVSGRGASELAKAGIECVHVGTPESEAFYESYAHWVKTGRPFVTAKLAMSLDGKIAGPGGKSVKISGSALDEFTHERRKKSDAILTTGATILTDNPRLNARVGDKIFAKPVYVLDRSSRVPSTASVFQTAKNLTIFCNPGIRRANLGVRTVEIPDTVPFLNEALSQIGKDGIHDLWVEAGGTCFRALLNDGLLNRAFIYFSPKWLGEKALSAFPESFSLSKEVDCRWSSFGDEALCEIRW